MSAAAHLGNRSVVPAAWGRQADSLASFALDRIVHRNDGHGRYTDRRTADGRAGAMTEKRPLTKEDLVAHFRGVNDRDIVGAHTTDAADSCKFGVFDIDAHGPAEDKPRALAIALEILDRLGALGIVALLEDSGGGYHVWILLWGPAPAADVHRLLSAVAAGLDGVECFPKQASVNGGFGNFVRLPGRRPGNRHWSTFWDGLRFAEGIAGLEVFVGTPAVPQATFLAAVEAMSPGTEGPASSKRLPPLVVTEGGARGYVLAALRGECEKVATCPPQGGKYASRHRQMIASARAVGGFLHLGVVSRDEMLAAIVEAGKQAGKPEDECRKAVEWGLSVGEKDPRQIPDSRQSKRQPASPRLSRTETEVEADEPRHEPIEILKPSQLRELHPEMHEAIVDGLLRRREILNLIGPSKFGKSWMTLGFALCLAAERPWLNRFHVRRSRVLIVDNELHPATLSDRLQKVAGSMGLEPHEYEDHIGVVSLRGRLRDLSGLAELFVRIEGQYDVVILDAGYRFTTPTDDENSNSATTVRYNLLDTYAALADVAIVYVHHSSKGTQTDKATTDVGAGAGAQSRAADTHLVLVSEPTLGPNRLVVDAAIRSFPPLDPFVIQRDHYVWSTDGEAAVPVKEKGRKTPPPVEAFVGLFASSEPQTKDEIAMRARAGGVSVRDARTIIQTAIRTGLLHPWITPGQAWTTYSTCPQPGVPSDPSEAKKGGARHTQKRVSCTPKKESGGGARHTQKRVSCTPKKESGGGCATHTPLEGVSHTPIRRAEPQRTRRGSTP